MNIYNWSDAPDWAMWATRDSNGFAHWHELEPYRTDNPEYGDYGVEWSSIGRKSWECDPFWNQEVDCPPAEDSKERRPVRWDIQFPLLPQSSIDRLRDGAAVAIIKVTSD